MPTDFDSPGPDTATNPSITRSSLLAELEAYEHLLFEPMTQADLAGLLALQAHGEAHWGDSPAAIVLTEALGDWIDACGHKTSLNWSNRYPVGWNATALTCPT